MSFWGKKPENKDLDLLEHRCEEIATSYTTEKPSEGKIDYFVLKDHIYAKLTDIDDLSRLLDSKKYKKENEIKYKNIKRIIILQLVDDVKKLAQIYKKTGKK